MKFLNVEVKSKRSTLARHSVEKRGVIPPFISLHHKEPANLRPTHRTAVVAPQPTADAVPVERVPTG